MPEQQGQPESSASGGAGAEREARPPAGADARAQPGADPAAAAAASTAGESAGRPPAGRERARASDGDGVWGNGRGRHPGVHKRGDRRRYAEHARKIPIFRLLGYYLLIALVAGVLVYYFPVVRSAFLAPLGSSLGGADFPADPDMARVFEDLPGNLNRLLTTSLVIVGALLLVLPIAWVYTFARRLRYDRSLVHSLILLPPVVAATVMVVKHSLALAFSLAGIVAAVRFRTTVKDPKDAVHVFLVMAIGLSAGVQALDIALLLSVTFAVIVLIFWKYDIEVYSDDDTELLSVGDSSLMLAQTAEGRDRIQERLEDLADDIKTDGILLIHTREPDSARQVAEVVLSEVGKRWIFNDPPRGRNGIYTLEAVVRLRKKKTPVDLLGQLEDRWSPTVAAAEYVPFQP